MDKLEHYLDQVCRSMGGPKALRQHVRQELREHLLDAAAQHKAAGLSEAEALDRAITDFGGPDEVRVGLEETHGHRLLPVLIDKAMSWKERTMRAKWLWMTWAHLAVALVIVLEVLWMAFACTLLLPRFEKLVHDGIIDYGMLETQGAGWMVSFLDRLNHVGGHYTTWLLLLAALLVGLFEWRVRSENKSFIRLSAWGTIAVILMVPAILTAGSLVIPYMLAAPASSRIAQRLAVERMAEIDTASADISKALEKGAWDGVASNVSAASKAVDDLIATAPLLGTMTSYQGPSAAEMRASLVHAKASLAAAQEAAERHNVLDTEAAMRKFSEYYEPVRKAAGKP